MSEPTWFIAKVDQRMALVAEALARNDEHALIMTPLAEPLQDPSPDEYARWDRSCDGCGKDCRKTQFFNGHVVRHLKDGRPVYIVFGVCENCHKQFNS